MEAFLFLGQESPDAPTLSCIGVYKQWYKKDLNISRIVYIRGNDTVW